MLGKRGNYKMGKCFAPDCKHYKERNNCSFFGFPKDEKVRKVWIRNIRRLDKEPISSSRICQCHFKNGAKCNGPTIFERNKNKLFSFEDPEKKTRRKKVVPSSDSNSSLEHGEKHFAICVFDQPSWDTFSFRKKLELLTNSHLSSEPLFNSHSKIELKSDSHSNNQRPPDSHSSIELPSNSYSSIELPSNLHPSIDLPSNSHPSIEFSSNSHSSTDLSSNRHSNIELPSNSHSSIELTSTSSTSTILLPSPSMLKIENDLLRKELAKLQEEKSNLQEFCFSRIQDREDLITYYTGAQTKTIFDLILKVCTSSSIKYFEESISNIYSVEVLSPEDQLLLTLTKLKLNLDYVDLGVRFNLNTAIVSNIFLTWINDLHEKLYKPLVNIILSKSETQVTLPSCYTNFKHCRMVVTCAEFFISKPKKELQRREFCSSRAHRLTMKCLIGVSPNGAVIYTSKLFPGSTTDEDVFHQGCFESIFQPGDLLLYADKAFLITDTLSEDVDVNIPHFLSMYQFTSCQVHDPTNIESAIIHVERAIQHIKSYKIVRLFPHTFFPHSTNILQVIVALSNFQPLIK